MTEWSKDPIRVVTLAETGGQFEGFVLAPSVNLAPNLPTIRRASVAIDFCTVSPMVLHVMVHGGWIDRRGRVHPRVIPVPVKPSLRAPRRRPRRRSA